MYRIRWCIMLIFKILILIYISRVASMDFSGIKKGENYGPYTIKWYNYGLCRGPKSKNATYTTSIFVIDDYGNAVVTYNNTFLVPTKLAEVKVVVWNVNGAQKSVLWNYKVNKPCQHFAIASLLEQYLTMHNCLVKPGTYTFKTNYTEIAHIFFGKSFFYGDYSFKITVLSNQGNVVCILINALFSK